MKDKHIEGFAGYAIYFDNIRVDKYVLNFNSNILSDGSMSYANISTIYAPSFYKIETKDNTGKLKSASPGFENMTNVKIFVKNVFSGKYVMVYDGSLRGKQRTRTPNGAFAISFNATDHMRWLTRTIVPLSIPITKVAEGDLLKWKAQGIDVDKVNRVTIAGESLFRGKTLKEFVGTLVEKTLKTNTLYSDPNTVAAWDNVMSRIKIMGDISEDLIQNKIIDFLITSSAESLNSLYVAINDSARNLMFEFYQDRDGIIRIKPPFWNERVLYDHIIDPVMINNFNEVINYEGYYTRVVVTGGVEEFQENMNDAQRAYFTPVGTFVGSKNKEDEVWSDYSNVDHTVSGETESLHVKEVSSVVTYKSGKSKTGIKFLDNEPFYLKYDGMWWYNRSKASQHPKKHTGIDWFAPTGTPLYSIGGNATVTRYRTTDSGPDAYGRFVQFIIDDGPAKGHSVLYGHMSKVVVTGGQKLSPGTLVGYVGHSGNASEDSPHAHLETRHPKGGTYGTRGGVPQFSSKTYNWYGGYAYNPQIFFELINGYSPEPIVYSEVKSVGSNILLSPSPEERKYGPSIYNINQPLIKFSNSAEIGKNTSGRDALQKYARFMYNLMNSIVETASMQVIGMPWLRPGFNIWVDPVAIDKIFYINSITHQGSPDMGVYTTLNLSLGRERINFTNGDERTFGKMRSDSSGSDNVFINTVDKRPEDFGQVIRDGDEFDKLREKYLKYYKAPEKVDDDTFEVKAVDSKFHKIFYGKTNADNNNYAKVESKSISSKIYSKNLYDIKPTSWKLVLKKGDVSEDVLEATRVLKDLGYYIKGDENKKFDDNLYNAVIKFQKLKNLEKTGTINSITLNAINKLWSDKIKYSGTNITSFKNEDGDGVMSIVFTGEYTLDEIQSDLNALYAKAPDVIKNRTAKLKKILKEADDYIKDHYIQEKGVEF